MANKINNQQMATQPETQSQNQSNIWPSSYLESQPIEDVVWGRLYAKNMRFSTLGIKRPNLRIEKSQTQYGIWIMFFFFCSVFVRSRTFLIYK